MASSDSAFSQGIGHSRERHHPDEDLAASTSALLPSRSGPPAKDGFRASLGLSMGRRTLGILCLMVTVFFWTLYNFMASYIFSDHSYDKPFFVVYFNTSIFALSLVPRFFKYLRVRGIRGLRHDAVVVWNECRYGVVKKTVREDSDDLAGERLLSEELLHVESNAKGEEKLDFRETAIISLEFSMLWFLANYTASACLEYTSVASVTILTSTSSIWTLVLCAMFGIERFTTRKFLGVGASLVGVMLISTVDMSGQSDEDRGSFPHKTTAQIAIGDAMALFSAVVYGAYVTVMKKRVGDEDRVDMQLFFGLVGVFNLALLWPIFFVLHWTGLEPFELPPTGKIWTIIIVNAVGSFISDVSWAYALLLTTPLVVTVGLSLTIPLSLIGEIIQYHKYSGAMYWIGAAVVFLSFVFVNRESHEVGDQSSDDDEEPVRGSIA
ncbi:putative vacuolar membrane protein [Ilyonectria robusta]